MSLGEVGSFNQPEILMHIYRGGLDGLKRYLLRGLAVLIFISVSDEVVAQNRKDLAYFCVSEFAGGLSYNATTGKWESSRFRVDAKFVLRFKFLKSRMGKDFLGEDEPVHDYNITLTASGSNYAALCEDFFRPNDREIITTNDNEFFRCTASLTEYIFNLKSNRFLAAYLLGYVSGEDNNKNTPSVSGGTCTKIE